MVFAVTTVIGALLAHVAGASLTHVGWDASLRQGFMAAVARSVTYALPFMAVNRNPWLLLAVSAGRLAYEYLRPAPQKEYTR